MIAAGVDTFSPCWYAEPGSPLARAMRALATRASGRAFLLPEPVGAHPQARRLGRRARKACARYRRLRGGKRRSASKRKGKAQRHGKGRRR